MMYLFLLLHRHVFYPPLHSATYHPGINPVPSTSYTSLPSPPSWSFISSAPSTSYPPLPLLHPPLIPFFLSSVHLWSPFSTLPHVVIPALPRAVRHVPVCELLVLEPACVVAPGQGWHSPAGMRGNRVWAFLYKRTIKPTAVHNELILIQVRCTSCVLSLSFSLFPFFVIVYTFVLPLCICSYVFSTCYYSVCISTAMPTWLWLFPVFASGKGICQVGPWGHLRHFVEVPLLLQSGWTSPLITAFWMQSNHKQ